MRTTTTRYERNILLAVTALTAMFMVGTMLEADAVARLDRTTPTLHQVEQLMKFFDEMEVGALGSQLAPTFTYVDIGRDDRRDRAGFLAMLQELAREPEKPSLDVQWIGRGPGHADVRGSWTGPGGSSPQPKRLHFAIELDFDAEGLVTSWVDEFRPWEIRKPTRGDQDLETEHFRVGFFSEELSAHHARQLGETLERYYQETALFLGQGMRQGRRLSISVAGCFRSPYASAPGPDAFILVPASMAQQEYGFSIVHELTHNILGRSNLSETLRTWNDRSLRSGNRLLDEGVAVAVEELLAPSPLMFPNFGTETHQAYCEERSRLGLVDEHWEVLEAEYYRSDPSLEGAYRRLAYLHQGSFAKYLLELHGVEKLIQAFGADLSDFPVIFGSDLKQLQEDWQAQSCKPPAESM